MRDAELDRLLAAARFEHRFAVLTVCEDYGPRRGPQVLGQQRPEHAARDDPASAVGIAPKSRHPRALFGDEELLELWQATFRVGHGNPPYVNFTRGETQCLRRH
jgi:hypothetical protein